MIKSKIPLFLIEESAPLPEAKVHQHFRSPFIEKGIRKTGEVIRTMYAQWELTTRKGFFYQLDARVKILFLLFFVVVVSLRKEIMSELLISLFLFLMIIFFRVGLVRVYKRALFLGFFFGFLLALPSAFNVINPGTAALPLVTLPASYDFWIYHIPRTIGITSEGSYGVALLSLRVINSLTISFLVLFTTPFTELIRALRMLRVPNIVLLIITLTYKYIFIFAKTIEEMYLANRARTVSGVQAAQARSWAAGRISFLFKKTQCRCDEVVQAMSSRGFSGEVVMPHAQPLTRSDWSAAAFFLFAGILFLLL